MTADMQMAKKEPSYASRKRCHKAEPCFPSEENIQVPRQTTCHLHAIMTDCCLSNLYRTNDFSPYMFNNIFGSTFIPVKESEEKLG